MNNKKRKAFSLVELVVTISIIMILVTGINISYKNYKEALIISEAKITVFTIITKYRDLAYYNNNYYTFNYNQVLKNIIIKDHYGNILETVYLPKVLNYCVPYSGGCFSINFDITNNGNMTKAFTFYIFNYKNLAVSRIAFYSFSELKYLKLNVYTNVSATTATFTNIIPYHATSASNNLIGWKKE